MKPSSKALIAVLIPTYHRPSVLAMVAKNIRDTTLHPVKVYFGVEASDSESYWAADKIGDAKVYTNKYEPGYPGTIQTLYEKSKEPFLIHANDDFMFSHHWDEVPMSMFDRPDLMVVGLKQTEGDDHGSAISMFRRSYIEEQSGVVDMPNRVFYPYPHHYVDTEFTMTAQHRGVWALCDPQTIIHMHPGFTGRPPDATYQKNDATSAKAAEMFEARRHLFS